MVVRTQVPNRPEPATVAAASFPVSFLIEAFRDYCADAAGFKVSADLPGGVGLIPE